MKRIQCTRRQLLNIGGALSLASLLPWAGVRAEDLICTDRSDLTPAQKAQRGAQHYVDASPMGKSKNCDNCAVFQPAADHACGSCLILPGPIHPAGYCDAWTDII